MGKKHMVPMQQIVRRTAAYQQGDGQIHRVVNDIVQLNLQRICGATGNHIGEFGSLRNLHIRRCGENVRRQRQRHACNQEASGEGTKWAHALAIL